MLPHYSEPVDKHCFKMAEKSQWCEHSDCHGKKKTSLHPNLLLPSDYRPQWPDDKRMDLSLLPFHCICCVYFPCILNLSPFKGGDNVCDLPVRRWQLQAPTINAGLRTSARQTPKLRRPLNYPWVLMLRLCAKKTLNSANPLRRNSEWRKFSMISCPG